MVRAWCLEACEAEATCEGIHERIAARIRALPLPPRPSVEEVAGCLAAVFSDEVCEVVPSAGVWLALARKAMEVLR